jgi:hypothetical protein
MEQFDSLLAASDTRLSGDLLDRIDELVPAGTNLNYADGGWTPPSVANAALRRR